MGLEGKSLSDAFERAIRHHQAGQLAEAEALYRHVLAANPRHADSLHGVGAIALQVGQAEAALSYVDTAIPLRPNAADFHHTRGNALKALGRLNEAERSYREALRLRGRFPEALCNLALVLMRLGRFAEAESCGRKAVRLAPHAPDAHTLLGHALGCLGRHQDAQGCYRAAVRLRPQSADAYNNLGHSLSQGGHSAEAERCYREALRLDPGFVDAYNNLGCCLKDAGRPEEAEKYFRQALQLRPTFAEALVNLADALDKLERYRDAEACCRDALRLKPEFAEAHNTLGSILRALGRPAEAEAACRTASRLRPNFALAHNNLGCALIDLGRTSSAITSFQQALECNPHFLEACNNLVSALTKLGQFSAAETYARQALQLRPDFGEAEVSLANLLVAECRHDDVIPRYERILAKHPTLMAARRGLLISLPYIPDLDPAKAFAIHRAFGDAVAAMASRRPLRNGRDPDRRLRIGWLSSDFRDHPVGRNLELFFAHRDRAAFESYCYADVKVPDAMTDRFQGLADVWRPISGLSDAAVAELARNDRIDVMVYLAGRFDRNRPQVAAWRPSPVQVSLFDAATSGLADMDYFIADPMTVPRYPVEQFTERVLRLPNFYLHMPPTESTQPGQPPCLSGGAVTFGSFHNPTKLNARLLAVWSDVLRHVPNARLRFKYLSLFSSADLQGMIRSRIGTDVADRIDFDPSPSPPGGHLAEYDRIDIALDPFPFNGSTATFEALWMGVPVVTLAGSTFMGRWAASMLHKVGLDDLIATSPQGYVETAARLAADRQRLMDLRMSLRERVLRSPLCDGAGTTRHLERMLRAVWRKWCREQTDR